MTEEIKKKLEDAARRWIDKKMKTYGEDLPKTDEYIEFAGTYVYKLMKEREERKPDIEQAKQILMEYCDPHSHIDNGNLFFAACEYKLAFESIKKENERLKIEVRHLKESVLDAPWDVDSNDYGDKAKEALAKHKKA